MTTRPWAPRRTLAEWALALEPSADDLALADRSLADTVAVALAARDHRILEVAVLDVRGGPVGGRRHVLDFDDLHMETTTHISTVCVPAALAGGRRCPGLSGRSRRDGPARPRLGWQHYAAGWHATTTTGALAAAVDRRRTRRGFDAEQTARAMALAVPAAGGVQRSFGTDAKSLQVGFAVEAGIRAATLAGGRGHGRPVGGGRLALRWSAATPDRCPTGDVAVPGGLAIKIYPACYALQRPIAAVRELAAGDVDPAAVRRVVVRTPAGTVQPLIHSRPQHGPGGQVQPRVRRRRGAARRAPGLRVVHRRGRASVRRPSGSSSSWRSS